MVSSALRAANRWLQSLVCTAYPLNGAILLAAILAPQPTLVGFSWAFLAGSAIGAAFAYGFVRQQFGKPTQTADECARQKVWKEINRSIPDKRSEERRVGKECVSTGRSLRAPST